MRTTSSKLHVAAFNRGLDLPPGQRRPTRPATVRVWVIQALAGDLIPGPAACLQNFGKTGGSSCAPNLRPKRRPRAAESLQIHRSNARLGPSCHAGNLADKACSCQCSARGCAPERDNQHNTGTLRPARIRRPASRLSSAGPASLAYSGSSTANPAARQPSSGRTHSMLEQMLMQPGSPQIPAAIGLLSRTARRTSLGPVGDKRPKAIWRYCCQLPAGAINPIHHIGESISPECWWRRTLFNSRPRTSS